MRLLLSWVLVRDQDGLSTGRATSSHHSISFSVGMHGNAVAVVVHDSDGYEQAVPSGSAKLGPRQGM